MRQREIKSANGERLFCPITVKYKKIINRGVEIFYSSHQSKEKGRKSDNRIIITHCITVLFFVKHQK